MKKLIAVICAMAMLLTLAMPAMANPSIEEIETEVEEVELESELTEESENFEIVIVIAAPEDYKDETVADVVTKVNDVEETVTVVEVAEALKDKNDGEIVLTTDKGNPVDPSEYSFVTKFSQIGLTDGSEIKFDDGGNVVAVRTKVTLGALAGMQDTSALSDYLIMLLDPETGKIYYLELDEESFDPETGAVTIDFPCLGAFSLIKK